jgi:hypothetical protein
LRRVEICLEWKFGIEWEIEGKDLPTITSEAQDIFYGL